MRYLVTGGTSFIGMALVKRLIAEGEKVNLLVRSPDVLNYAELPGVAVFQGDITDAASVGEAIKGCSHVFHLAAYAKPASPDPLIYYKVNVEGTRIVLDAAKKEGIERVVFCSTAGTFGVTGTDEDAGEESPRPEKQHTKYAESKLEAEKLCAEYEQDDLQIVIVYPSKVFGPGILNTSNSLTKIISMYVRGRWRIIPGNGKTVGNYVFVNDIVKGLIHAMDKGRSGESYLLGGHNITFTKFLKTVTDVTRVKRIMLRVPYAVLWIGAASLYLISHIIRKPALISPSWIKHYLHHKRITSNKAISELGYEITPLEDAIRRTVVWLNKKEADFCKEINECYTLITGASSGIGEAIAKECAIRGMNLFLVSLPETGLGALSSELRKGYGVGVQYLEIDLSVTGSQRIVIQSVRDKGLMINALINNVGVGFNGRFESMEEDKVTSMFMLNILNTTLMTQLFLPMLKEVPRAYILNVASLASFFPLAGKCIYSATKAYVMYFTSSIRKELKGSNITVTGVYPAAVPTNEMVKRRIREGGAIGRRATASAEDVARESITGMLKGKATIFPGNITKSMFYAGNILPQGIVDRMARKEFEGVPF
ncbi:MAG: SDR family NAD(P)-dependent oxidoreductase [Bacteroidales bacterium]